MQALFFYLYFPEMRFNVQIVHPLHVGVGVRLDLFGVKVGEIVLRKGVERIRNGVQLVRLCFFNASINRSFAVVRLVDDTLML